MTARWMLVLIAGISIPAWGQSKSQDRVALTARQLARTLIDRGLQIGEEGVALPANVVATEPSPMLDVLSGGRLEDQPPVEHSVGRSWVKLSCQYIQHWTDRKSTRL